VAWASNFGYEGPDYADIYAIALGSDVTTDSPTVRFSNPATNATVSGTTTVTMVAAGGSGTGYTYRLTVDGVTVYSGSNGTFSWNTTAVANGAHTLQATVIDSSAKTATASRVVTVSNSSGTALTMSFITPLNNATVKGTVVVALAASGGSGTGYTYTLTVDGVTVYVGDSATFTWNSRTSVNGPRTLRATVTDSAAATATVSRVVTVASAPTVKLAAPATDATVSGTTTISMMPAGGTGTGYTYKVTVDGVTIYRGGSPTFTWNTTSVSNASHTLKATVTDSAGRSGSASREVTVSNAGIVASFTSPARDATLSGTPTIRMKVNGSSARTRTFKFYVDIYLVWQTTTTGTTASYPLDTNWWTADGQHVLKLVVTDSAGKTATTKMRVNVIN
jgi:hypothetical protein